MTAIVVGDAEEEGGAIGGALGGGEGGSTTTTSSSVTETDAGSIEAPGWRASATASRSSSDLLETTSETPSRVKPGSEEETTSRISDSPAPLWSRRRPPSPQGPQGPTESTVTVTEVRSTSVGATRSTTASRKSSSSGSIPSQSGAHASTVKTIALSSPPEEGTALTSRSMVGKGLVGPPEGKPVGGKVGKAVVAEVGSWVVTVVGLKVGKGVDGESVGAIEPPVVGGAPVG
mmetsp:Transcript_18472/g.42627  ORF Transcript_18472/g.42627 Transcript_18472/m.42627 type:complete len:232 (-) Transcript_18472:335-1030(-)